MAQRVTKIAVAIATEYISLDKLLKLAGIVETGGQAFVLVEQGSVAVDGRRVKEKRRKIYSGASVRIDGQVEIQVFREENAGT